jgi:hypothetical protein
MQAYLGTKIILAELCCKEAFDQHKKNGFPVDVDFETRDAKGDGSEPPVDSGCDSKVATPATPATDGYHVVYSNPDGSKYHSWSPKDVFERSYRRIETDEKQLISTY